MEQHFVSISVELIHYLEALIWHYQKLPREIWTNLMIV